MQQIKTSLSTWGIDHVRVPVDYNLVETEAGEYLEEGFAYLQRTLDWCSKYGLNMILDLHKTMGYSFSQNGESVFFTDERLQERFYALWEQFAERFGGCQDRIAFELLNEVTLPSYCAAWNRIADNCIRRIRNIAPNVKILVVGHGNNSVSAVKDISLSDYDNIVLNFHCYEPFIFTHQAAGWLPEFPRDFRVGFPEKCEVYAEHMAKYFPIAQEGFCEMTKGSEIAGPDYFERLFAEAVHVAEEKQVPLYCGEYGVIENADAKSALKWYQAIHPVFVRNGIGRSAWTYKQMSFGFE
ncbi:MAG: glycoside hydrolase family 5 protein, partial [Lachnospiraceae bacterium]|nr:glycoside hydrolase family 5 protein [Lachnospiraceae bacterium]